MMYLCSHPSKSSATLPKFKSETCATPRRYISEPFKTRYSAPHPYSLHTPSSLFQSLSPIHRTLPIPTSMRRRTNPPFGSATTVDRAGRNLDFNEKTHGLDRSAPKPTWKSRRYGSLPRASLLPDSQNCAIKAKWLQHTILLSPRGGRVLGEYS